MAGNARRQRAFQVGDQAGDDVGGGFHAAQDRYIVLLRHFQALIRWLNVAGEDQGGDLVGKQLVEYFQLALVAQGRKIIRLNVADDLQAQPFKMIEKARQRQAGPRHFLDHDGNAVKIRRGVGDGELKFLHNLFQQDAVRIHGHDFSSVALL